MKVFRRYKSVVFRLILLLLSFSLTCCEEKDDSYQIENENDINEITYSVNGIMMKEGQPKTWTYLKITITPEKENTDISLNIKNILDESYIKNKKGFFLGLTEYLFCNKAKKGNSINDNYGIFKKN